MTSRRRIENAEEFDGRIELDVGIRGDLIDSESVDGTELESEEIGLSWGFPIFAGLSDGDANDFRELPFDGLIFLQRSAYDALSRELTGRMRGPREGRVRRLGVKRRDEGGERQRRERDESLSEWERSQVQHIRATRKKGEKKASR